MTHASPPPLAGLEGRLPRLLVVDDHPANIQVLHQVFGADHQVLMATAGEQALTLAVTRQPDLVLLDVGMPGMDGHEVCRRLKADPATRDIPVIFVTAFDDEAAETLGLDVGAVDFIRKPINPNVVRARVRTHLTLKAQADMLRQWVYLDGLTGVPNRRHFDERVVSECGRARRGRSPLSVVMIDVDHFKRFNDHYGHLAGDDCLRRVAGSLRSGLKRPGDLLARYGGEEFVCLLPDTPLAGALQVARQLGEGVAGLGIEHARSDVASHLTISLGVCTRAPDSESGPEALLRAADAQLYLAKARGRNQACGQMLEDRPSGAPAGVCPTVA